MDLEDFFKVKEMTDVDLLFNNLSTTQSFKMCLDGTVLGDKTIVFFYLRKSFI